MEKKVLLSVQDLVVKFHVRGRVLTAIRGISLDIYENESIAIVGESGSGKSVFTKTFANMLDSNGFVDQGKIIFSDETLADFKVTLGDAQRRVIHRIENRLNAFSRLENGAEIYKQMKCLESEAKHKVVIEEEAEKVRAAGGLFILGTERHESRRIDNQLRGRAGRQGDPGETCFYLSLEDDILRLFGGERIQGLMDKMGVSDDTPIDAKMLSGAIENAQKRVESRNFQARKDVLDYDDVMNTQREVIYEQRRKVLAGDNLKDSIAGMIRTIISNAVNGAMGEQKHMTAEHWKDATAEFRGVFLLPDELSYTDEELEKLSADELIAKLEERAFDIYNQKETILGEPLMRELERVVMLRVVDEYWMEHIDAMEDLKQGIRLRAYGQEDPVVAYKREGYDMFETMIAAIQDETVRRIYITRVKERVERKAVAKVTGESGSGTSDGTVKKQPVRKKIKIGRNDPCPCGSGLKWKKCTCAAYHSDDTTAQD